MILASLGLREESLNRGHERVGFGDQIKVQLTSVNVERRFIDFVRSGSKREPSAISERFRAVQ